MGLALNTMYKMSNHTMLYIVGVRWRWNGYTYMCFWEELRCISCINEDIKSFTKSLRDDIYGNSVMLSIPSLYHFVWGLWNSALVFHMNQPQLIFMVCDKHNNMINWTFDPQCVFF